METQSRINFIPCVKWVKRGVARSVPEKVGVDISFWLRFTFETLPGATDQRRVSSDNQ